ncbi:MAG: nuclear transport factor 2 family protein [Sphingomonas sp.]
MSAETVAVVRAIYSAFAAGDVPAALGAMSPGIVWHEAEHHPYADGSPYVGPEAVAAGVFARCGEEWEGFAAVPDEILDAGDTVVALGRYTAAAYRATGRRLNAQMVHVWRVEGGKAVAFQQYTDTLAFAHALGTA